MRKPFLPGGERVLVVNRQSPLHREVDLLALDAQGGLVLIEVKNERSTREAIGQSLEYLAQYAVTEAEDLEEGYAPLQPASDLKTDFRKMFKHDLKVTQGRRVFLVADSFDSHSALCARYLGEQLHGSRVEYGLMRACRKGEDFSLTPYECPPFTHSSKIKEGFAVTRGGRLFYVLKSGPHPIMWYIGRRTGQEGLRLAQGSALARNSLQVLDRPLIPEEHAEGVDVTLSGTVWKHRVKPGTIAKVLGQVLCGDVHMEHPQSPVIARLEDGQLVKCQRKSWSEFDARWRKVNTKLPDWRSVVASAR